MFAVAVKDNLIKLLNEADDVHKLVDVCNTVIIPVLTHTEGFWQELHYCYKAAELADRAQHEVDNYIGTCQHHKTHEMLVKLRNKLRQLGDRYRQLQQEYMEGRK